MHNTCLKNLTICYPKMVSCSITYSSVNAGILITTKNNITAYQVYEKSRHKSIMPVKQTSFHTAFLSWTNTGAGQTDDLFVEKPNLISSHLQSNISISFLKNSQILLIALSSRN